MPKRVPVSYSVRETAKLKIQELNCYTMLDESFYFQARDVQERVCAMQMVDIAWYQYI